MSTVYDKSGVIFDVQRFSLHDGPGIRTTVFFKGCPLKCRWCHNPESWKSARELFFHAKKCVNCGACVNVCPQKAQSVGSVRSYNRSACINCGACAQSCPTGALEVVGRIASVDEIMSTVIRDRAFYGNGGGLTVSGGEPFMQSDFLIELLRAAKENGIHTCVETSGAGALDRMLEAKDFVDLFLYDCKLAPGKKHEEWVGVDGVRLHEKLKALDKAGAKSVLRCPIIPTVNDNAEHFAYISSLADSLSNLQEINIQPYHSTGLTKAEDIGNDGMLVVDGFNQKELTAKIENELMPLLKARVKVCIL